MVEIPYSVGEISAEWLRASVRPDDAAAFASLTSIRAERLGEGVATTSDIHRLVLGYAPGGQSGPAALVVKMPSSSPEARELAHGWSTYRREVLFYRNIAATVGLRIPKAYVAEFNPETERFVLVMDDLSASTDGDQIAGLPLAHVRLALDEIVGLHATWWNRPELVALEAFIEPYGEELWAGSGARHTAAWPGFAAFVAARASPELVRVGERLGGALERMMRDMSRTPRTLCHGDFRAGNMLFSSLDGAAALAIVDWQAPMQAKGAFDVGYLMSMSITTELRRAHEADLLRSYHQRLTAGGVEDYPYETFFRDYRRGLLIGFTYVVHSSGSVDMGHPRILALFDSAVRRVDAALQDHCLAEFVD